MKKIFFIIGLLLSLGVFGQAVYNPAQPPAMYQTFNKPVGVAQPFAVDARSLKCDSVNFLYRAYAGTSEVLSYLNLSKYRYGWFPIVVNVGGSLQSNGTFVGGQIQLYFFKNGTADSNLVRWYTDSTTGGPFFLVANNLSEGNATTIKTNLSLNNVDNTSDATKWAATATLTNKTISGSNNTFTNIPNSALNNSTIGLNLNNVGSVPNVSLTPASLGGSLTLSVPYAATSASGFLSNTDWNDFDTKLDSVHVSNDSIYNCVNGTCNLQSVLAGGGAVNSVNGTNASLLFSPTTGNVLGQVNPAFAFNWTAQHTYVSFAPIFSTLTTAGGLFYGNGTGQLLQSGAGTSGEILQSTGGTAPIFFTPNASTVNGWLGYTALSNALGSTHLFVGNGSNIATDVALTGDIGINNTGLSTIQPNVVSYSKIQTAAGQGLMGATGAGNFGLITLGTNLSMAGNVLNGATEPALTSTYIGYGSASNLLTGTSEFNYNHSGQIAAMPHAIIGTGSTIYSNTLATFRLGDTTRSILFYMPTQQGDTSITAPYGNFWKFLDQGFTNPDGQRDAAMVDCYNCDGGGGRINSHEASFGTTLESHFQNGPSHIPQFEWYFQTTLQDGSQTFRPIAINSGTQSRATIGLFRLGSEIHFDDRDSVIFSIGANGNTFFGGTNPFIKMVPQAHTGYGGFYIVGDADSTTTISNPYNTSYTSILFNSPVDFANGLRTAAPITGQFVEIGPLGIENSLAIYRTNDNNLAGIAAGGSGAEVQYMNVGVNDARGIGDATLEGGSIAFDTRFGVAQPIRMFVHAPSPASRYEALDVAASGNILMGTVNDGNARLILAGQSSTLASINLGSGTLVSSIAVGNIENNNAFYFTNSALNRTGVGGAIADFFTDVGNSGTSQTDLYTYTTKANTLNANGEKLKARYSGNVVGSATASRVIAVFFAGTQIYTTGTITVSSSANFDISVAIIRSGSTTARAVVNATVDGVSLSSPITETDLTGLTFSGTNILKITGTSSGTGSASNDIVAKLGDVFWYPAANN